MNRARQLLESIPEKYMDRVAKFLDSIEKKEEAFRVVVDIEHKFELAISLAYTDEAYRIAQKSGNLTHFKSVGDLALHNGQIPLAIECFKNCQDLGSLLMIYSSLGLKDQMRQLGELAE
jgi:coatomer subunit beta'